MINPGLEGRVALVTGANNPIGIGAAAARAFAAQAAKVFITYLRQPVEAAGTDDDQPGEAFYRAQNAKTADAVIADVRAAGGQIDALEVDLADPAAVIGLFDCVEAVFGPAEILVNNAAHSAPDTFVPAAGDLVNTGSVEWLGRAVPPVTAQTVDAHFAVNTRAPALMMAEFARRCVARGASWGRIINVSTGGAFSFPSEASYGASKWALESYSRAAAAELGQYGITVNVVSPGPIQTGWIIPALEDAIARSAPLGRVGYPEDVADVVVFLASEQARWLTGQVLQVGGGHRMT